MVRTRQGISLVFLIYLVAGIVVAYQKHYLSTGFLKAALSALLAIVLWFLLLLGVDLHVR